MLADDDSEGRGGAGGRGAEEHGLVGSLHYTSYPLFPWERHAGMTNLEMIGRNPARQLNLRATGTSTAWKGLIKASPPCTWASTPPRTTTLVTDSPERIELDRLAEIARSGLLMLVELV